MRSVVCVALACSLEAASGLVWVADGRLLALVLHLGAAAVLGVAFWGAEARRAGRRRWIRTILVACVPLFLPMIGALGLGAGVLPVLGRRRRNTDLAWRLTRIPSFPARAPAPGAARIAGAVAAAARGARTPSRRVLALLVTRRWPDVDARPLLTASLRDTADEVRLVAYALLQGREKTLYEHIKICGDRMSAAEGERKARLHRLMARAHWDLIEAGFAQGAVRARTIEVALGHVDEGLALSPRDGVLHLLEGRLRLELNQLDDAVEAFTRAAACGLPARSVAPFLARAQATIRAAQRARAAEEAQMAVANAARRDSGRRTGAPRGPRLRLRAGLDA